jgi:hypothetical protein
VPTPSIRLHIGLCQPLPPAIVGLFAAAMQRDGRRVDVVREAFEGPGELWVALEPGFDPGPLNDLLDATFFGPGCADPTATAALPGRVVAGDPIESPPDQRAIATWSGFELPDGARRILAGDGTAPRPLGLLLKEIVYGVEMHRLGHLQFDDQDLARYPGWQAAFDAELRRLPWLITWEGTAAGARHRGGRLS